MRSDFGNVRARDGRYQARYQTPDGRQHSKTFDRSRAAWDWLADARRDLKGDTWIAPTAGRTLFGVWEKEWRATVGGLRVSTRVRDFGYVDRYILPTFAPTPIGDIDAHAVRRWQATLGARLAPATVAKARQILGKIMAAAVGRLVASNPVTEVSPPTVEVAEVDIFSPGEIRKLAGLIDPAYRSLVFVGCYGGLRGGELLALKAGRVNRTAKTVRVVEAATGVSGKVIVGPVKTRAGMRTVPLPKFVVDELPKTASGLLWPRKRSGGYQELASWRERYWRPAVGKLAETADAERAAELAAMTPHAMRHTAVTLWLAAGATPVQVARWAGHTSARTVLDRYGHVMADGGASVMDALGRLDAG